jgi:hypothetical protein
MSFVRFARAALLCAVPSIVHGQSKHDLAPFLMADRSAEIALARTAAMHSITDSATIMVLTRTGYAAQGHGTNGFTCLVMRGFTARAGNPVYWDPKNLGPACFNDRASKTVLPAILKQVDLLISGLEPEEVETRIRAAYANHEFVAPAEGSMAFMLSHEQHLSEQNPHWNPHVMIFVSSAVSGREWGVGSSSPATVFDDSQAGEPWPVLTLFIPVQRWSDGTAVGGSGH